MTNRTRTRRISSRIGTCQEYWNNKPSLAAVSYDMNGKTETMSDVIVPRYFQRVAKGEVINNPCHYVESTQRSQGGWSYRRVHSSGTYEVRGDGSLTAWYLHHHWKVPIPGIDLNTSIDQKTQASKQQALASVDATPYGFAEDIGEIAETLRFLRDPLSSLKALALSFRAEKMRRERFLRSNPKQKEKVREKLRRQMRIYLTDTRDLAAADVWLTYRFAFSPLMRSISSLTEALGTTIHRPKRRTSRSKTSGNVSNSGTVTKTAHEKLQYENDGAFEVRSGILYEVTNPVESFAFKYGVRFKDIPVTAWNLLPLSFMADRIVNISNCIRGLTNLSDPTVNILAGWVVTKKTVSSKRRLSLTNPPGWTGTTSFDTVVNETFTYDRTTWQPGVQDTVPAFTPKYLVSDISKTLDLLALVHKALT